MHCAEFLAGHSSSVLGNTMQLQAQRTLQQASDGRQNCVCDSPAAVLHDQDELIRSFAGPQQLENVGMVGQVGHHVHLPSVLQAHCEAW